MALNEALLPRADWGSSPLPSPDEQRLGRTRKIRDGLCVCAYPRRGSRGVLRSTNCLDRREGLFRRADERSWKTSQALAHYSSGRLAVKSSVLGLEDELGNGRQIPLTFSNDSSIDRFVVAVDVDEVLGSFLSALNKFVAEHYAANHSLSEFYVYEFFRIWKCSRTEADLRVHEFFKTAHFKRGIKPIPGAHGVLARLSAFCHLSVVTSRQKAIKEETEEWIEEHYGGLFKEVHFGNHFALEGQSRAKSEICRSVGARVLVDDNPRYAVECAEAGIRVLLFDYAGSYPWSKCPAAAAHPLVTTVHTWAQVERAVRALARPAGDRAS
ncbi:haloacid dehalogenase-like hydrolase (HAD) superfamily protein isoform X2 [Wolffia australiana]